PALAGHQARIHMGRGGQAAMPRQMPDNVTVHGAVDRLSVIAESCGIGLARLKWVRARATRMLARSIAAILLSASPLPPDTTAPAWPIVRPFGAVRPAMKPAVGFLRPRVASSSRNCAVSSSAEPPIPTAVVWPRP